MKKEIATQDYYMLQKCMRCNLWIHLIQFLVQIEPPQIKPKKKQREARIFNFISYITLINHSEPRDYFDWTQGDKKVVQAAVIFFYLQDSLGEQKTPVKSCFQ